MLKMEMTREEIRAKRIILYEEQAQLEQDVCAACPFREINDKKSACEGCLFAESLLKIGDEICELTKLKKKDAIKNIVEDVQDNGLSVETYQSLHDIFENETEIPEILGVTKRFYESWKLVFITRTDRFVNIKPQLYFEFESQGYTTADMAELFGVKTADLQRWKEAMELTGDACKVGRRKRNVKTRFEIWQELEGSATLTDYLEWVTAQKKSFEREKSRIDWQQLHIPMGLSKLDVYIRKVVDVERAI